MIGWLLLGLVIGLLAGFGAAWVVLRGGAREPAGGPSLAAERSLAEPIGSDQPADEEIHQALDATRGLLDELEGRYRGRTAPPETAEKTRRRRPRKP